MFLLDIWNDKKIDTAGTVVESFLTAVAVSGIAALPFIKWRLPFQLYRNTVLLLLAAALIVALFLFGRRFRDIGRPGLTKWHIGAAFVFLLLLYSFWLYLPDTVNDVMLETIRTTVATDTVYEYNPLTGRALELGMYPISKLYTLPLFYSVWMSLLPADYGFILYYAVPIFGLVLHFLVVSKWGSLFWKGEREKTGIFLIVYGLVLLFGDYHASTLAYRLLHQGWSGLTLFLSVCIPYLGYLCAGMRQNGIRLHGMITAAMCLTAGIFLFPMKDGLPMELELAGLLQETVHGKYLGLYIISVLFLVLNLKKEDKKNLLFLPLMPIQLIIAYAAVTLCLHMAKGRKRAAVPAAVILLIALAGSVLPYKTDLVKKKYIYREAEAALEIVERLAEEENGAVLLAPDDIMKQARAYSADIFPLYGKDLWNKNANQSVADDYTTEIYELYELMKTDYSHPDEIAGLAREYGCNVLLLRERMTQEEKENRAAWEFVEEVPGYLVYRLRDVIE